MGDSSSRALLMACARLSAVIFMSLALVGSVRGQTGVLDGQVADSSGQAISGVQVAVISGSGVEVARTTTAEDGAYSVGGLAGGLYTVRVEGVDGRFLTGGGVRIDAAGEQVASFVVPSDRSGRVARTQPVSSAPGGLGARFDTTGIRDLPLPTNIWFLIGNLEPSSIPERLEIGGIGGLAPKILASRGSSWTETAYSLNGAAVSDPQDAGRTLFYPLLPTVGELTVTTARQTADTGGAGSGISVRTLEPGEQWHGSVPVFYQSRGMQGSNMDAGLRALGVPGSPRLLSAFDARGYVGGPLLSEHIALLTAVDYQRSSREVPGFPEPVEETVRGALGRLDYGGSSGTRVSLLASGHRVANDHEGASAHTRPEATWQRRDRFEIYQAFWSGSPRRNLSYQGTVSVAGRTADRRFQEPSFPQPTRMEAFRKRLWGSAPFAAQFDRQRITLGTQFGYLPETRFGTGHFVRAGAEWSLGTRADAIAVVDDQHLVYDNLETHPYRDGLPLPLWLTRFNTPVMPESRVVRTSVFATDQIRLNRQLSVSLGVRSSLARGSLPDQASPAGSFAPSRRFSARTNLIRWNSFEPRVGIAYRPFTWLTIVRFSFARYAHTLAGSLLDHGNPNALSSETYMWEDANGDGEFQEAELGRLLRVDGGLRSAIDPDLSGPYTREFTLSVDHGFPHMEAHVVLVHRRQQDRIQTVNTGVPFSAYTPVGIVDPGEFPSSDDDRLLTVYDQDAGTLGADGFLLTNPEGLNARHRELQVTLARRNPTSWQYFVTGSAYESRGLTNPGNSAFENDPGVVGNAFRDPNTLINADSRLYFDRAYTLRIAGYYETPWGTRLTGQARYFDGQGYARNLIVRGFSQGPFLVMATPKATLEDGGPRTEYNAHIDFRIRQPIPLPNGDRLDAVVDIYNLLNANSNTIENDLTGPAFRARIPLEIQPPRSVRVGLRYEF